MKLLGRAAELRVLSDQLTAAQNSAGSAVVVSGEAGIGKSHLLGIVAGDARSRGFRVLEVRGHASRSALPFDMAVALLDSLGPGSGGIVGSTKVPEGEALEPARGGDGTADGPTPKDSSVMLVANRVRGDSILHRIRQSTTASDQPPPALSAVGTALLLRFCKAADEQPVLIVVDDVQWADPSSISALCFVAKRLFADRIVMVFGRRTSPDLGGDTTSPGLLPRLDLAAGRFQTVSLQASDGSPSLSDESGPGEWMPNVPVPGYLPGSTESSWVTELEHIRNLVLEPLSDEDSIALLESLHCGHLEALAASPLAGGLPLALAELARNLTDPAMREARALETSAVPQTLSLPAHYLKTIELLPPDARRTLALCALDDEYQVVYDVVGVSANEHLMLAKQANVLDRIGPRVEFRHPLLRAASLAWLDPGALAALHGSIAAKLDPVTHKDRIAQHLSAAATGPDAEIADALDSFAVRARARSAHSEAASAWARSAELTIDPDEKAKRLIDCAKALHVARFPENALVVAEQALSLTATASIRASAVTLIGNISMWDRNPEHTTIRVLTMVDEVEEQEPASSAWACIAAASLSLLCAKIDRGVVLARRAEQLAKVGNDPIAELAASAITSWNLFLTGEVEESSQRVGALTPIVEMLLDQQLADAIVLGQTFTMRLIMEERFAEADRMLIRLLPLAQRLGDDLSATLFSVVLSTLRWRQGRSDEAMLYATEYLQAERLPALAFAWAAASAAQIFAALGRVDRTKELCNSALASAGSNGVSAPLIEAWALAAQAHVLLSHGDCKPALALYQKVETEVAKAHLGQPEFFHWHGDYLETLLACGHIAKAKEVLHELFLANQTLKLAWVSGVIERTEAQLCNDPEMAAKLFSSAVAAFQSVGMPFEVARTLLTRGRKLREHHGGGHDVVAEAKELFENLGATVWGARCVLETDPTVAASGRVRTSEPVQRFETLSEAERRVVLAIASGRTNAEAAEELYLSARTIEFHLGSIYRKLAVKNRTSLMALILERRSG